MDQLTDWFQIGKGVQQGCIFSPCLFKLHAECIMQNARLDEAQAVIKIVKRNINNLRYADDTTLMAERGNKSLFAGIQPRLIQGVRSGDGIGEDQDTIASIRY